MNCTDLIILVEGREKKKNLLAKSVDAEICYALKRRAQLKWQNFNIVCIQPFLNAWMEAKNPTVGKNPPI